MTAVLNIARGYFPCSYDCSSLYYIRLLQSYFYLVNYTGNFPEVAAIRVIRLLIILLLQSGSSARLLSCCCNLSHQPAYYLVAAIRVISLLIIMLPQSRP